MATSDQHTTIHRVHGPYSETAYAVFTTVDGADPTVVERHGVLSVTRTGEGVFLLTLPKAYSYCVSFATAGALAQAEFTPIVTAADPDAGTIEITVASALLAADDAPGLQVHVTVIRRLSS